MWVSLHLQKIFDEQKENDEPSHESEDAKQYSCTGMRRLILTGLIGHGMPLFAM
jgi:hypothetical protein